MTASNQMYDVGGVVLPRPFKATAWPFCTVAVGP